MFLFTGKFFCKSHFIHCKTNSQQRKRRAELKQQKEVSFISKVVVKWESSLVGGGCQEFLQVRPMFLALGGLETQGKRALLPGRKVPVSQSIHLASGM